MSPHPLIATWLQRHGRPASDLRADGRLTLQLAEAERVDLRPLPDGQLLLEARIAGAQAEPRARDAQLERLLRAAASSLRPHPQQLAFDDDAAHYSLQQRCAAALSPIAFEQQLEAFVQALRFWQAAERGA